MKWSDLLRKTGENAEASMSQPTPISSKSEEKYVTTPKEDGEKEPTPKRGIHSDGGSWFSKLMLAQDLAQDLAQKAMDSSAMGMPPEGSRQSRTHSAERPPAIDPSSPPFRR
jgi:hypothetical protein